MRRVVASLFALSMLPFVPARGALPPGRRSVPTVIPLKVLRGHVRTVRVAIGGDSLDFMFDTGNGTMIMAEGVASRIGCTPLGRGVGFRMTGERVGGPACDDVALSVGGVDVRGRVGVTDMSKIMGGPTELAGVIGLTAFVGRTVTLDLAGNRLVLETAESAARRTRAMHPVPARLATGESGGNLCVFLGIPASGTTLWMEWDSGHNAATFVAPHAARLLGIVDTTVTRTEIDLALAGRTRAPVIVKDVIHDGVLSAGFLERGTWTVDLASGRAWVSDLAPLRTLPDAPVAHVAPPATDPVGTYEMWTTNGGHDERGVLAVWREAGELRAALRGYGEDETVAVRDVRFESGHLRFAMVFRDAFPVDLAFDGLTGTGLWGDPAKRGGAARAIKRS